MAQKIDTAGTYVGTIAESGVSVTKKGFPQWVARLTPTRKYIESKEEIEHFQKQNQLLDGKPGYVDWSAFGEEIVAFSVLFNSATEFSKATEMLNYEQLQLATGWDGTEFDSLGNGTLVGKEILFRVAFNSYTNPDTGKVTEGMQVTWIDNKDASPERQLKSLDSAAVQNLNSLLRVNKPNKPVVAAASKPAASKPAKVVTTGSASQTAPAASTAAAAVTPSTATSPAPTAPVPPAPSKKAAKKEAAPPPVPVTAPAATGLPKETDQATAWAAVCSGKGDNEDNVVEEAWIAACSEVGENKDEGEFTPVDWAKVRDIVLKDLAA